MLDIWGKNIRLCLEIVQQSAGPEFVTIVSGSDHDRAYWQHHATSVSRDVFRADGSTKVVSVAEMTRKGNFLGTLQAWSEAKQHFSPRSSAFPNISLMTMVFGQGKRLSPFTQALGNRKPAFMTPRWAPGAQTYLKMADLSSLCSNMLIQHLDSQAFRGLLVKWGDEAIIPGTSFTSPPDRAAHVDVIRTAFHTDITEELAREKDWIVTEKRTGLMHYQYSRQPLDALRQRIQSLPAGAYATGVNLGALAISYDVLDVALDVLGDDMRASTIWADWDPYVWMALFCRDQAQWRAECEHEEQLGKTGIKELEARYPDFYPRISRLRSAVEARTGHPFTVRVLDFGEVFWADFGLHQALRKSLESLTTDSVAGSISRDLFGLAHERDARGNLLIRSQVPPSADVRDSVIVDSIIQDADSVIHRGVIVGGRHRTLHAPDGGSALFCAADRLTFTGPHGIAFRAIGHDLVVPEGGRYTSLVLPEGIVPLRSSETIIDYNGEQYTRPIFDNRLSFEEAAQRMTQIDGHTLDALWQQHWQGWL